jgi:hypothetical protein
MARSSLLGTDRAPREPKGRDTAALGPGDNSDSGSDMMGIADSDDSDPGLATDMAFRDDQPHPLQASEGLLATSDAAGTGERRSAGTDAGLPDGSDIGVDRVFSPAHKGADAFADDDDGRAFLDEAEAGDPLEDESDDDIAEALGDDADVAQDPDLAHGPAAGGGAASPVPGRAAAVSRKR